ncbi:MAG: hypothetical protein OEW97_02550 [Gammaproteobacteria bacterium]|nr:hypothetical protein [Gammaproteobacteria bacterium]
MDSKGNITKDTNQNNFDLRPAAVKQWIENLPLGSTGESSKQIFRALKTVNSQTNTLQQHLDFLEAITPTICLLQPRLTKYFTDVSLPLGSKTRNAIHITNCLLTEMLHGYHSIIKSLSNKKPFGWKKPFALALHRSFIYTSKILTTQHLSYQPSTKGTWRQLFWCYQQAEKTGLLNKAFRHTSNNNDKTTLEYEFKKLILLSLLSVNSINKKNMSEVLSLMPVWIKHIDILQNIPDDKKTCFTLNLLSDVPPYIPGTRNDPSKTTPDRHYFSTLKLINLLINKLAAVTENDGTVKIASKTLSKTTVQSLLNSWSRNHLRTDVRKEGSGFVDIVTGITAIHFVLSQQDQPAYDEVHVAEKLPDNVINFESTLRMDQVNTNKNDTLNLGHFLSNSDQQEDIWSKAYENSINIEAPQAHWTESGIHKVYSFAKSILLDQSKDGFRLSVNASSIDSLKLNELVAIREHALAPWALAQVKWLHFTAKGDLQFGLRVLTHHVLPIQVSYQANNIFSKPLPCLLGLDRSKLMLFVPNLPTNLNGKKLQLDHQNQRSNIYLKNKLLSNPAFDIYEILETEVIQDNNSSDSTQEKIIVDSTNKTSLSDNIWKNF